MKQELHVSFGYSGGLVPSEISEYVGLQPSKTWTKGEKDPARDLPQASGWSVDCPLISGEEVYDGYSRIEEFIFSLEPYAAALGSVSRREHVIATLGIVIYLSADDAVSAPYVGLSQRAVQVMAMLGARVVVEIYRL